MRRLKQLEEENGKLKKLVADQGWRHGQNKTRRIYRELGLQLRHRTPKRRVKAKLRDDRRPATRSNEIWAMDFVHDQLATGHKLRVLTIVDIFSRFSPVLQPRLSFRGSDVVAILERACKEVRFPATIRVDQGSEFVSRDLDLWAYQRGVTLDFSRPGKPTDTDVVDKPYVAEALRRRDRGFARHRDVNLMYSFSADSTRARSSALFAGTL